MEKNNRTIAAIASALLTMACMASTCAAVSANEFIPPAKAAASASDMTAGCQTHSREYDLTIERLNIMCSRSIDVKITHNGFYRQKSIKLDGRKAIGAKEDGSYILGSWELIDSRKDNAKGISKNIDLHIDGDYVMLAYSFDIVWGTDFPYSGVFWDATRGDKRGAELKSVEITTDGTIRNADIEFGVEYYKSDNNYNHPYIFGQKFVNCDSHTEWKPN